MLAIIGTVGVPACYGGFETLVDNLLDEKDSPVLVYCSGKSYEKRLSRYKNATPIYLPLHANGVQSILYDVISILDAIRRGAKTILVLGVSGAIVLPLVRFLKDVKIVTNIDGLEWRRDKWGKLARRYLKWAEMLAVKSSDIVISDNQAIADYVLSEYGYPSEVIAYGGDHAVVNCGEVSQGDYALGICRIEPENNVHMILEAFGKNKYPLVFIGNWNNSEYGRNLKLQYAAVDNIRLLDPVYDVHQLAKLRQECLFYVHGHSAGGTNPSLVEMMHFIKPILCFDCNYNRATTESKARYFTDVNSLADETNHLMRHVNERVELGVQMQEIALRRYTWQVVKQQYANLCYAGKS